MFDEFWKLYPRKVAKRDAEKAFKRLKPDEQASAIESLPNHIKYWELKETDKEFIPHPATWLNGARFEDEIELTPKKQAQLPWFTTDALTMQKGSELGMSPRPGETMADFRNRIQSRLINA